MPSCERHAARSLRGFTAPPNSIPNINARYAWFFFLHTEEREINGNVEYLFSNWRGKKMFSPAIPCALIETRAQGRWMKRNFWPLPDVHARMYFYALQLVNGLDVPRYMCETEVMEDVNVAPTAAAAAAASVMEYTITSGNHTSKNANGNIITLTLKNNHLIVETEERAVCYSEISGVMHRLHRKPLSVLPHAS